MRVPHARARACMRACVRVCVCVCVCHTVVCECCTSLGVKTRMRGVLWVSGLSTARLVVEVISAVGEKELGERNFGFDSLKSRELLAITLLITYRVQK